MNSGLYDSGQRDRIKYQKLDFEFNIILQDRTQIKAWNMFNNFEPIFWQTNHLPAIEHCTYVKGILKFELLLIANSVTRLGDLLDVGQLFKAYGNN